MEEGSKKLGVGLGWQIPRSLPPLRSVLPCDFLGGPASSPEVMEEEVEDEDFLPLSLFDFLVSFFRFPAKLLFPPLQESLLGSVVVGMCTG